MIDSIKQALTIESKVVSDVVAATKDQVIESVSTSKLPAVIAGGTYATTFTTSEFAKLAALFVSLIYGGKMLVDIWARITEVTMKKREIIREEKRRRKEDKKNPD
jgi:TRAP-type C4-dicarboxylate transport system permease large subunit